MNLGHDESRKSEYGKNKPLRFEGECQQELWIKLNKSICPLLLWIIYIQMEIILTHAGAPGRVNGSGKPAPNQNIGRNGRQYSPGVLDTSYRYSSITEWENPIPLRPIWAAGEPTRQRRLARGV